MRVSRRWNPWVGGKGRRHVPSMSHQLKSTFQRPQEGRETNGSKLLSTNRNQIGRRRLVGWQRWMGLLWSTKPSFSWVIEKRSTGRASKKHLQFTSCKRGCRPSCNVTTERWPDCFWSERVQMSYQSQLLHPEWNSKWLWEKICAVRGNDQPPNASRDQNGCTHKKGPALDFDFMC